MSLESELQRLASHGLGVVLRHEGNDIWRALLQNQPRGVSVNIGYGNSPNEALSNALKRIKFIRS